MTIHEALRRAEQRLRHTGVESPDWDADALLRHVLRLDRAGLIARYREALAPETESLYFRLVAARAERRPLQHLTGSQCFWRHEFIVSSDVLIPRPETEMVVQAALDLITDVSTPQIADVGTGSGCIAISLACERPDATIHATEISHAALEVARANARRLSCESRVRLYLGDLLSPLAEFSGEFSLVVSNPPYIDPGELATLPPEVRDHDPRVALLAPGDAYSVYRRLVPEAQAILKKGGWLVLEIGSTMETGVREICAAAGLRSVRTRHDLRGLPRVVLSCRG